MVFSWLNWLTGSGNRQKRLLESSALRVLPALEQWPGMAMRERNKLAAWAVNFCSQKIWEGCNGLRLSDDMKLLISGQAGLLVLGWERPFYFPDVRTILVYPDSFVAPHLMSIGSGMHIESRTRLEGQAWYRGPVIISWSDVVEPNRSTAHNLVIHEFAHQLDMLNGGNADGIPPLPRGADVDWQAAMRGAVEDLKYKCEVGVPTVLDCYGCESDAEFFAVSSEAFFEVPRQLADEFPDWFEQLQHFFQTDPIGWQAL